MEEAHEKTLLEQLFRKFITGSHILHYHNVLDAYGHLSFRHPTKPDRFFMSYYIAPGTISSPSDIVEYYINDAEPVATLHSGKGYTERCIHSEIYKRWPTVHSIVHNHSEAVVPYSISRVPLRACFHMAGFLKSGVPVWNIKDAYRPEDVKDLLVRNTHLGGSLAEAFSDGGDKPAHAVVLMRGHGATVVADNIEECVKRAIYMQKNAMIQTTALTTRAAFGDDLDDIQYVEEEEFAPTMKNTKGSAQRPWGLWVREVEASNLYVNSA